MAEDFAHTPVLVEELLQHLQPRAGEVFCDGTVGGGGHAERILEASAPDGRLIGIDRDEEALAAAARRLARFGERARLVHGELAGAAAILRGAGVERVDGMIADLGISSPQVDRAERGFSFMLDGPLDMRMDRSQGETAAQLLARLSVDEIRRLLDDYGEEPFARPIARAIAEASGARALRTTGDLARVVVEALPARERQRRKTHPATLTFQALRIAVNDELGQVAALLDAFPSLLAPGGRIAVISFHSLEDRLVKNRLRDLARHPGLPEDVARDLGVPSQPTLDLLTRHAVFPSPAEVASNPRSRSARLRAARMR